MLHSICHFFEAKLTTKEREDLPDKVFALPNRRYPIHDKKHARLALAMIARFGSTTEKARVRNLVYKRYPEMRK